MKAGKYNVVFKEGNTVQLLATEGAHSNVTTNQNTKQFYLPVAPSE